MAPISNHFNIFMYIKPQYNVTLLITWANKMAPNKRVIMRSYCITVSSKMMNWIFESNIPHELSHVGVQKLSVGNHEFYNMNGLPEGVQKLSVGNHEFDTNLVQKGA